MKVIYDYQIFDWQKYGGISRYYYELVKYFTRNHTCESIIIAPLHVNKYIRGFNNDVVFGKYFPIVRRTYRIRKYINMLITKIMLNRLNPDILHETYYNISKLAHHRTKTVITVYDMIHEKFPGQYPVSENRMPYIKSKAINRADHVICISENTRKDLIELTKIASSKTSVVHLGFSLTKYISEVEGNIISRPYILFVGQRGGYKNFQRFLQGYASSKRLAQDFELVCFGGFEFSSDELRLIRRLGLASNKVIRISGDDKVLSNLYANAAAFIYPSLYEGFGIPLLEAMSYQCPVVCSEAGALPEVAGDAAEYFDPYLVDNIMVAIENVVYSTEKSKKLIARGLTRISHFSWDKCAQQTYAIYSSLL